MTRSPKRIGDVLPELMARRGYSRVESTAIYHRAWAQAAGPLTAQYTRLGSLRRGTLEIVVANSTLMQELGFQKSALLEAITQLLPDEGIDDLRFRIGPVG
jgi:predicted nucleic acid-binding Zn ribbon protein